MLIHCPFPLTQRDALGSKYEDVQKNSPGETMLCLLLEAKVEKLISVSTVRP